MATKRYGLRDLVALFNRMLAPVRNAIADESAASRRTRKPARVALAVAAPEPTPPVVVVAASVPVVKLPRKPTTRRKPAPKAKPVTSAARITKRKPTTRKAAAK